MKRAKNSSLGAFQISSLDELEALVESEAEASELAEEVEVSVEAEDSLVEVSLEEEGSLVEGEVSLLEVLSLLSRLEVESEEEVEEESELWLAMPGKEIAWQEARGKRNKIGNRRVFMSTIIDWFASLVKELAMPKGSAFRVVFSLTCPRLQA